MVDGGGVGGATRIRIIPDHGVGRCFHLQANQTAADARCVSRSSKSTRITSRVIPPLKNTYSPKRSARCIFILKYRKRTGRMNPHENGPLLPNDSELFENLLTYPIGRSVRGRNPNSGALNDVLVHIRADSEFRIAFLTLRTHS